MNNTDPNYNSQDQQPQQTTPHQQQQQPAQYVMNPHQAYNLAGLQQNQSMPPTYYVAQQQQPTYQQQPVVVQPQQVHAVQTNQVQQASLQQQQPVIFQPMYLQPQYAPHGQVGHMVDQRHINLSDARKSLKKWGRCQLITAYLWIIFSGFSVVTTVFMLFSLQNWTEVAFWDHYGQVHYIKLGAAGLFILSMLKIVSNVLLILWGRDALITFKPIMKEVESEEINGVLPQPEGDTKVDKIKLHSKKVFKILIISFVLMTITILYAKSYFTKVTNQFINDEYDLYERKNGINTTQAYHPTAKPMPQWDTTNETYYPEDPVSNETQSSMPNSTYAVSFLVSQPEAFAQDSINVVSSMVAASPPMQPLMGKPPHHGQAWGSVASQPPIGAPYQGQSQWIPYTQSYRSNSNTLGPWGDMDLENWDFSKTSRSDAKLLARTLINTIAVAAFAYATIAFACLSGVFLCALKRVRKVAQRHEECAAVLRGHVQPQQSMATGTIRQANGLGFERVPINEPADDVHQYNPSINAAIIPRGVVIN